MSGTEEKTFDKTAYQGLELRADDRVSSIVLQYADRGIAKAAAIEAENQILREAETRAAAPDSYRLSKMSDSAVDICYRHGKDCMSATDLIHYVSDTRLMHLQRTDLTEDDGIDRCTGGNTRKSCTALTQTDGKGLVRSTERDLTKLPARACKQLAQKLPTWFDTAEADTSQNSRRFPLSAFAALLAVAASLLLIVASSVMVRLAESDVSRVKTQISCVSVEAAELKSDLEVGQDVLQIRQIATEEYGMISEEYVKMDYISLCGDDTVEVYKEEREERVGLSALLSAIGLK